MKRISYILKKPNTKVIIYLVIIVGVTLIIYYPTFAHLLRGETYIYFLDTAGDNSAISLIKNYYNYEEARVFAPGDELTFRPLLFTVLGLEKGLFGANYTYWHITAFLAHLLVTLCLFRLLWKIKPAIIALFATLLFSTSFMALETILYEEVAPYALFMALVLIALYYVYCGVKTGKKSNLIIASISMLIACFFNEMGVPFTVLLIGYFWLERKQPNFNWKPWSLTFSVIILIYLATYIPSKFINPTPILSIELNNTLDWQGSIPLYLKGGWALSSKWFLESTFPAMFRVIPSPNLLCPVFNTVGDKSLTAMVELNALAVATIGGTFLFTKARQDNKGVSIPFFILIVSSLATLIIAITLFRVKTHGMNYLVYHSFNVYCWAALFIVAAYALINLRKITAKHMELISISLIVLIGLSAPYAFICNHNNKTAEEPTRAYFQEIDDFIELHQGEQDFSFNSTVEPQTEAFDVSSYKVIDGECMYFDFTIPQILYWSHWDEDNPKYILTYYSNNRKLGVITNE